MTDRYDEKYINIEENKHNYLLPYATHDITTYPKHTAVLGILGAHNRDEEWLYNNYGLFWVYRWSQAWTYWVDFKYGNEEIGREFCPLIKEKRYARMESLKDMQLDKIVSFFKYEIAQRRYNLLSLDMYYIVGWTDVMNKHVRHQALLYGYNDKKEVFYLADFFENTYTAIEVSFENFYKAVTSVVGLGVDSLEYKYNPQIETYEFVNDDYEIDIDRIKSFVMDFITSSDTTTDNFLNLYEHRNALYGFAAMEQMVIYMKSAVSQQRVIDVKILYIVRLYNEILKKRLDYLEERSLVIMGTSLIKVKEDVEKIIKRMDSLNLMCLKYACTLKSSTGNKVIDGFHEVKELQKKILYQVYLLFYNRPLNEFDKAMMFKQYDLAKEIYFNDKMIEKIEWIEEAKNSEVKTITEIKNNCVSSELKKKIKSHAKGKSIFSYKQYFNVFPYETEEKSFVKKAKLVRKQEMIPEIYKYYWREDNISCIKFVDENLNPNWMCYDYYDNRIMRYWIMKDVYDEYNLMGVKVANLVDNKVTSIYSYKNLYGEIKKSFVKYNYERTKIVNAELYSTNASEMAIEKWLNPRWKGINKYYYNEHGDLIQIVSEKFGKAKTVFSYITMDEKEIEDIIFNRINELILKEIYSINISYITNKNKIVICGNDESDEISFFEAINIEKEEIERISYLIAFAVYRVNSDKLYVEYFIDGEDVTEQKRYKELLKNNIKQIEGAKDGGMDI